MFDGKAFGAEIVEIVRNFVDRELAPLRAANAALVARLEEVETREPLRGEPGPAGRDGKDGEAGPAGRDGIDGKAGERGAPGRDGMDGQNGADGRNGRDGEAGPSGRDGVDGRDGDRGEAGRDGMNGKDGADGRDGVGLAGALIDREGRLVVTMANGEAKELGSVVGKDGADGKDGRDGERGRDGFGFDDFEERIEEDGRTIVRTYRRGDVLKEFRHRVPTVIDCGVYKADRGYERGDGVTWAGSYWIAQRATSAKPDGAESGWRLAVKRGQNGRDGRDGKDGPAGRDLISPGPDGSKWSR